MGRRDAGDTDTYVVLFGLEGGIAELPEEERCHVGEFLFALQARGTEAMAGFEIHTEEYRLAAGSGGLKACGHLRRLPG